MDFDHILKIANLVVSIVSMLVSTGVFLYVRSSDRHEVIDKRFTDMQADVDERLDGTSERLARLEERVNRSPTHDDVGRVYERINVLAQVLSEIKGSVDALSNTMRQFMNRVIEKGMP